MNFTPQSAMQRIQVGLIGLVAVLLFVSIADLVFERVDRRDGASSVAPSSNAEVSENRDEPLAEMGVAPTVSEQPKLAEPSPVKTGSQ